MEDETEDFNVAMATEKRAAVYPDSPAVWESHRDTISRLYLLENRPLKEVQKIMEDQFQFKATKRMYNIRINKWHLNKHYKAKEKEQVAAKIAQAYLENNGDASEITLHGRPVKLHRIIRHNRTVNKRRKTGSNSLPALSRPDHRSESSSGDEQSSSISTATMRSPLTPNSRRTPRSSNPVTPETSSSQPDESPSSATEFSSDWTLVAQPSLPTLMRTISPPANQTNLEAILQSVRTYYSWYFDRSITAIWGRGSTSLPGPTERDLIGENLSKSQALNCAFWFKIKSAVYFLKVKSPWLAWPLLNDASGMAGAVVDQHPRAFLMDVFATISPVNTAVCPEVRKHLIQFLASMFSIKFGPYHPFLVICHNLQMDLGCRKTSETALRYMTEVFEEHLDSNDEHIFKLKRSVITLCRRDHDLDAAEASAIALMKSTEARVGPDDKRTRTAIRELAHIHMDQLRYEEAAKLCLEALARGQRGLGDAYPDDRCVHTMEDLAQIYLYIGDQEKERVWLQEALQGAFALFGKESTTIHILEKLEVSLEACERSAEAIAIRQQFDQI